MNSKKTPEQLLEQSLALFRDPSTEAMESAADRVRARLTSESGNPREAATPSPTIRRPLRFFAAAVAVGVVVVVVGLTTRPKVEVKDSVSRVSMKQIESHEAFRSENRTGTTLVLSDESRVELRVGTELSFDRATDGLRILLKDGSILVSAAKQRTGHLYVQTKDVNVSVVGTVFLVKAEQQGSRVAVIEGEVRVQKGATTERLLPGEQVSTSSQMAARTVLEEISWSSHAGEHVALLQQQPTVSRPAPVDASETFEVVSIRPVVFAQTGTGRDGGGGAPDPTYTPCAIVNAREIPVWFQLDPGRLVMRHQGFVDLVAIAYGHSCPAPGTVTGGADWTRQELFDIEATLPSGTPRYALEQLLGGEAPKLQRMLQNMLADRFKLVLKREVKETQGFNLSVVQAEKLTLSADQTPDQTPQGGRGRPGPLLGAFSFVGAPISRVASRLQLLMNAPIIDKTGLTALYDTRLTFPEIGSAIPADRDARIRELLPSKLEAVGLKLERARVPVPVLVISSAERPSEN